MTKVLHRRGGHGVIPHDRVSNSRGDRSGGATPRRLVQSNGIVRAACALALLLVAGCPATSEEVRPPSDQFYFPTGLDISPDQELLFVANGNSDLRYDGGMVIPVSLARVDAVIAEWLGTGSVPDGRDCNRDLTVPYTLECNEREAVLAERGVRIGNFVTDLQIQTLEDGTTLRVFTAVRGDPSLTWSDWNGEEMECGGDGTFPECDDDHRLTQLRDDADLSGIPDEPFGLFVDSVNGYVMVTHLTSGSVTLATAPPSGASPILSDAIGNLFAPDPNTGIRGAVGAAGRLPGTDGDRIYVTSRSESRVQVLTVLRSAGWPVIVPAEYFFLNRVLPSTNGRDIAFSADGNRAYIINRSPPMLHIIDTSLNEQGVPKNELQAGVEICPEASNLSVADAGRGERVYVACFRNGQVWVVDPIGAVVDAIVDVGRGPHGLVASPDRARLYVTNHLEDTVAVIDLTPESTTENRVVLRLGRTRQSGGE
jgi:DNA-binding beta-propeller fold protein YncE